MRRLTCALAASALLLAGCSSSTATNSTASTPTGPDTIVIKNFSFSPAALTVAPGTKLTVTNQDSVAHTLTSTSTPRAFDTGTIDSGATVTFTAPSAAGSYPYFCSIHPNMHGMLTVS